MTAYLIRRLLLVIQFAPGGPVEQMVAELRGKGGLSTRLGAGASDFGGSGGYRGSSGLDPAILADIKAMFGFDKPPLERFTDMLASYLRFDFGSSFFRDTTVIDLMFQKMPVSISLGLWSTLLIYLISIPLGIAKAAGSTSRPARWCWPAMPSRASCSPSCWSCCSRAAASCRSSRWVASRARAPANGPGTSRRWTMPGTWCCPSPPWWWVASPA
jgi:microcin C transport system permease protein